MDVVQPMIPKSWSFRFPHESVRFKVVNYWIILAHNIVASTTLCIFDHAINSLP
jgi:hypothetical protein